MTFPLSSWLRQISQVKMRLPSAGSATRLSADLPYQVVMLSLEIERQKTSDKSPVFVQRSMRAKSPSVRGRYLRTRYVFPLTVLGGTSSDTHLPLASSTRTGTRSSAPERINTSEST